MKIEEKRKGQRIPYSFYTAIIVFNTTISLTTLVILVAVRNDIVSKSTFHFGFIKIAKELTLAGFAQITRDNI